MAAERYECAIVGGGAAGLGAALTLGRARRRTLVVDEGRPRNDAVEHSHGFPTRDGLAPREYLRIAREELERYPRVRLVSRRVERVDRLGDGADGFAFDIGGERVTAGRLLLATGVRDELPDFEGLAPLWGKSVFTCPYCDAYEFRDRPIGVYGSASEAVHLAQELFRWSRNVEIFIGPRRPEPATDGTPGDLDAIDAAWLRASGLRTHGAGIRRLVGGGGALHAVELLDGTSVTCEALFLCVDLVPSNQLARRLGCRSKDELRLEVDENHRTSVPRVYAAGDLVTRRHQVLLAAASGAQAAIAINDDIVCDEVAALAEP